MATLEEELIDVIIRTKNSEEFLRECLQSIYNEIPVRRIIIVDAGSTDKTLEIASSFDKACIYVTPEFNLGQQTKFGFSKAETEWVAVIDSDMILRKGWFESMIKYTNEADAVEGCEIGHYRLDIPTGCKTLRYGRLGQVMLKREAVLHMDLDLPFGEDAAISFNFEKQGMKWKKVEDYLADHYPKFDGTIYRRTGTVFRLDQVYVPKKVQIDTGHIAREYNMITKRQAIDKLVIVPLSDAYKAFKKSFWFCLAYFRII